jgi:hypothetical protein
MGAPDTVAAGALTAATLNSNAHDKISEEKLPMF